MSHFLFDVGVILTLVVIGFNTVTYISMPWIDRLADWLAAHGTSE